jgi:4-amino-4-deoxy-L-arabinose transferase-like glycosyltransferase
MLAANPVFLRAATNAIPDMPLHLSSAWRSASSRSRRTEGEATAGWAWLGWTAIALAVLTKGLLPLVLVAALVGYVALADRGKAAAIFRPLPMALGFELVAAWYVHAGTAYPKAFGQSFGDR